MSTHLNAKQGEIAPIVLLPGDPLRAQYMAEQFLENAHCYNNVRGMYGFTGTYLGQPISIQGTGMGAPSISIYAHELINEYGAKLLIRVGTCGGIQPNQMLNDIILAMAASTDSQINKRRFNGLDFAPTADFHLLRRAYEISCAKGLRVQVGPILSSDTFYVENNAYWKMWADNGILAVEMETAALYSIAAQFGIQALSILTICDLIFTDKHAPVEDREKSYTEMFEIALQLFNSHNAH